MINTLIDSGELIADNLERADGGELLFAGSSVSDLAKAYGTPLYLYDEQRIRKRCRTYKKAMNIAFGERQKVLYASKAASFKRIYEIMADEGMGIDVVSCGEIFTAQRAGFPLERAYFHSNNKTDADIRYAIDAGVGCFVVDNEEELLAINEIAVEKSVKVKILLRLTPGIDPHTYAAVATGKVDSKFGSAIETGQAEEITRLALSLPAIDLLGFHCHIGSQVFDSRVYLMAAKVMMEFVAKIYENEGFVTRELDIGGGIGVRYVKDQEAPDIEAIIIELGAYMKKLSDDLDIPLPEIAVEPGRSIVADAGLAVYTVGTVKRIPGYKNYVSVDGGMADNPRFALYGSSYTIIPVASATPCEHMTASVVGRCCESGDILQENVPMPEDIKRGDLIACLTAGAYHYSMASNYNRLPRPPVIMVNNGQSYIAIKRETPEDVTKLDV